MTDARRAQFESLVRTRVMRTMIRARVVGIFVIALLMSALWFLDPTPMRMLMFAIGIGLVGSVSVIELVRIDREVTERRVAANVWLTAVGQAFVVLGAGGIASPFIPAQLVFSIMVALFVPRAASLAILFFTLAPIMWIYAWLETSGAIPGISSSIYPGLFERAGTGGAGPWLAASVYTLMLVGSSTFGRFLRRTIDDLVEQQVEDRERALEMHAEQARTLTALSAEIAHELKNPLASIKGLAGIVEKDLSGVPLERIGVLRREIDRMQLVLDEFLAYSRPLVPLEAQEVDVRALAIDVAELHEGMAEERSVRVAVTGTGAVRCDPRKLRAVLINLVQNALDASKPGSDVTIDVAVSDDASVAIRVLDRGAGIDPHIAARLFTVGATTKPKGNGIGLAVARGLARQHGGDLVLEKREGGGTVARMTLPREPRIDEGAAA
jgi:signal transduction histidine kinase